MIRNKLIEACTARFAAARAMTRLVPVGGPGDKVFPPTYKEGQYAREERLMEGRPVKTVTLDSVQSQANRLEEALLAAMRGGELKLPILELEVPGHGLLTSLDVPHRVHDAIFRDSLFNGKPFRESQIGVRLAHSRAWSATAFFELAPTALLFGSWDSQSGAGINSAKIARAIVSEIVGIDAVDGVRTSSRIDPLTTGKGVELWKGPGGAWTLDQAEASDSKGKLKAGWKKAKPSDVVLGNITPTITPNGGPGGVTIAEARQTTVLSFTQLRKLRFPPEKGQPSPERDVAGRVVLAALGLYAVLLQWEDGYQLRSRCQLVPVEKPRFELVGTTAKDIEPLNLDLETAKATLNGALQHANSLGLQWQIEPIRLTPQKKLLDLVKQSDQRTEVEED